MASIRKHTQIRVQYPSREANCVQISPLGWFKSWISHFPSCNTDQGVYCQCKVWKEVNPLERGVSCSKPKESKVEVHSSQGGLITWYWLLIRLVKAKVWGAHLAPSCFDRLWRKERWNNSFPQQEPAFVPLDKDLSSKALIVGPERWWAILRNSEAMGNRGGWLVVWCWRANRSMQRRIGAKDSSNHLVAGFFWSFPQDSWSLRDQYGCYQLCSVKQRIRGFGTASSVLPSIQTVKRTQDLSYVYEPFVHTKDPSG